jgi:hypothetical protein
VKQWVGVYLPKAHARIQALLEGVRLSLEDVYAMQMMCAYEVRTPELQFFFKYQTPGFFNIND